MKLVTKPSQIILQFWIEVARFPTRNVRAIVCSRHLKIITNYICSLSVWTSAHLIWYCAYNALHYGKHMLANGSSVICLCALSLVPDLEEEEAADTVWRKMKADRSKQSVTWIELLAGLKRREGKVTLFLGLYLLTKLWPPSFSRWVCWCATFFFIAKDVLIIYWYILSSDF